MLRPDPDAAWGRHTPRQPPTSCTSARASSAVDRRGSEGGTEHFGCMRTASTPFACARAASRPSTLCVGQTRVRAVSGAPNVRQALEEIRCAADEIEATSSIVEHAASCRERRCGRNRAGREGAFEACHPRLRTLLCPTAGASASLPSSARQSLISDHSWMLGPCSSSTLSAISMKLSEIN